MGAKNKWREHGKRQKWDKSRKGILESMAEEGERACLFQPLINCSGSGTGRVKDKGRAKRTM